MTSLIQLHSILGYKSQNRPRKPVEKSNWGFLCVLLHDPPVTHRERNESVVEAPKKQYGPQHYNTDEAEGPAGPQQGVHLRDEHGPQGPGSAP